LNIRNRIIEQRLVTPDEVAPNPRNWRTHPQSQRDALRGILGQVGIAAPVIAYYSERAGNRLMLIDGHERMTVGVPFPCAILDVDDAEADTLLATFDPITAMATANNEALDALLRDVTTDSPALTQMLAELAEDAGLYADTPTITEDDVPEPPVDPITKPGDLWILGEHRLLCGDSTKAEDVERLMAGAKADMVFTDPPYGISLDVNTDARNRSTPKFNKPNQKNYEPIIGDDSDYDPAHIFRDFGHSKEIFLWGADYYAERISNKNDGSFFVWDKRQESSDSMIGSSFELCWSKSKHRREIVRVLWCGLLGTESQDIRRRVHPTQKPLKLCEWFFEKFSAQGAIIADLFLGSGTTLIAAEQLGRKCYGMEISPAYCDVIVNRWETLTGKKAVRVPSKS